MSNVIGDHDGKDFTGKGTHPDVEDGRHIDFHGTTCHVLDIGSGRFEGIIHVVPIGDHSSIYINENNMYTVGKGKLREEEVLLCGFNDRTLLGDGQVLCKYNHEATQEDTSDVNFALLFDRKTATARVCTPSGIIIPIGKTCLNLKSLIYVINPLGGLTLDA